MMNNFTHSSLKLCSPQFLISLLIKKAYCGAKIKKIINNQTEVSSLMCSYRKQNLSFFIAVAFLMVGVLRMNAATKTWNGSSTNNWNTSANWTPSGVPIAADDVIIPTGYTVILNANGTCNNLTLSGSLSTGSKTLTVSSNWNNNEGTFIAGTGTVIMTGAGITIGGTSPTTFNNLTVGNYTNTTTHLGNDQTVNGKLILNNQLLKISTFNITLGTAATIPGTFWGQNMIVADDTGQVRKLFNSAKTFIFPIGDSSLNYSPITLNFTSGTFSGGAYAGVNVTNAKHPKNTSTTNYLSRYWSVNQSGISAFTCTVTGTYIYGDDVVGNRADLQSTAEYNNSTWTTFSTPSNNIITANDVTSFGDFTSVGFATITPSATSLTGFDYIAGSGPSAQQQFTVSGFNLSNNITITPPADYEISTNSGFGFQSSPFVLPQSGGFVYSQTFYIRLKTGLPVGNYAENISLTSTGAAVQNIALSGAVTYCASYGNTSYNTSITSVTFNTINNTSSKPSGYTAYTDQSTNVVIGNAYALTVKVNTAGNYTVYAYAWIDWNQNGVFDSDEAYNLGSARNVTNSATNLCPYNISVPTGAVAGSTRMRVSCKYNTAPGSCDNAFDGEVEDYTINVVPAITGTTALSGFNYIYDFGPSSLQSFIIDGSTVYNDITIKGSTDYEISTDGGSTFTSGSITVLKNRNTTVYVRLKAGLTVGTYNNETITLTSGTITKAITCSGFVSATAPSIVAGGGIDCSTNTINLKSTYSAGVSNLYWTGPNSFYSTVQNPSITNATSVNEGTYTVTGSILSTVNLITNGDFEAGVTGFTSEYTYWPIGTPGDMSESRYAVVTLPSLIHSGYNKMSPDHTSKTGYQLVINGAGTEKTIWSPTKPITVTPNTNYQFIYWVQTVVNGGDTSPSKLQLYANGVAAGPVYTANPETGSWMSFVYNWNSGSSTTVNLQLKNENFVSGGNDFALDDISFQPVVQISSSVKVTLNKAPSLLLVTAAANPVNAGTNVTFSTIPTNGGTAPTFQWYINGAIVAGATSPTYSYVPLNNDSIKCIMTPVGACVSTPVTSNPIVIMTVNPTPNYWVGTSSTSWSVPANWSAGVIPASGDDIIFATDANNGTGNAAKSDLYVDANHTIGNLTNLTTNRKLVVAPSKILIVNQKITTNDANQILIQSAPNQANGSLIFPQSTTAVATVQMYTKAQKAATADSNGDYYSWQYFGIPLSSVVADPTFYGSYIRKQIESGNYDNKWVSLTNSSVLNAFQGYEITQDAPTTLSFQGQLVNTDKTITLPYTAGAYAAGQTLLANPYTAAINIGQLVFGSNTENTVYLYNTGSYAEWYSNADVSGTANGQYLAVPKASAGVGSLPSDIPSMSGFMVKATAATGSITINYNSVITKNVSVQRAPASKTSSSDKTYIEIALNGEHSSDRMWLIDEPGTTREFDNGWDGYKLTGAAGTPMLFAMEESGDYQVSTSDNISSTYLGFQAGIDLEDTLTFKHENIALKYEGLYLVDLLENKIIDISQSGTQYTFLAKSTTTPVKRFKIVTEPYIKNDQDSKQLKVFNDNSQVFVNNLSTEKGELTLYDMTGRHLKTYPFGPTCISAFPLTSMNGAFVANATTNSEKVSKPIIVKYEGE